MSCQKVNLWHNSDMHHHKETESIVTRRQGFTLAEVLITLGIIGVVAAMTLPSLIAKYQERELVTRAKRTYSVVMNALNAYNTDNQSLGDYSILMDASKTNDEILAEFSKYLNNVMLCKQSGKQKCKLPYTVKYAKPQNNGSGKNGGFSMWSEAMLLNDGAILALRRETANSGSCFYNWESINTDSNGNYIKNPDGTYQKTPHTSTRCGRILVDTNGYRAPNRIGSDVFIFQVYQTKISFMESEGNLNYILNYDKIQPYTDYKIGADYGK